MQAAKLRASRFRYASEAADVLLPPPLPLINLPDEVRLACTGMAPQRPEHLPVRRHIQETRLPLAAGVAQRQSEPILRENRQLLDMEAQYDELREVIGRAHVYEYNQPEIYQMHAACALANDEDDTLVFGSLFESGNLLRADRVYRQEPNKRAAAMRQEYELQIHPDIKNGAYRQWFYFEVRNGRPGVVYKFSLINLAKSGALFGAGLQPVVYSEIDAASKGTSWVHRGSHVRYDVATSPNSPPGTNALSFQYEFEHKDDCVYFACLQPYTYTDLIEYLEKLERDPERAAICRRTELCESIAHNPCDLLSITSSGKEGIPHDDKKIIVISARVHPGEPNSSWMMKGMIDYLTGPSSGANVLRQHFIFKIVPMLNPDGVVNGNTRVNLAGWDLNRKWSNPVEKLFPTVYHLKRLISTFQSRDRVAIYCDLHGHSLNRNIFTYGCYNVKKSSKKAPSFFSSSQSSLSSSSYADLNLRASMRNDPRVFPMIVARNSQFFSFASCDFKVHKSKINTARVVVNHELGVINSYTLEASFCGPDFGPRKDTQFSTIDLEDMGSSWCQSLLLYFDLLGEVKALDLVRREEELRYHQREKAANDPVCALSENLAFLDVNPSELLSDCEVAISELYFNQGFDNDGCSMDSDLSDAEEEPIPPNADNMLEPETPRRRRENGDGYTSAPEQEGFSGSVRRKSTRKASLKDGKRKSKRKKKRKGNATAAASANAPSEHSTRHKKKSSKRRKSIKSKRKSSKKSANCPANDEEDEVLVDHPVKAAHSNSATPQSSSRQGVVLPSMPGSAGRCRLKLVSNHGNAMDEADSARAATPVNGIKTYRSVKTGSSLPFELPHVTRPHDPASARPLGLAGENPSGSPNSSGSDDDEDEDDSDDSTRSDPESYASEF